ncbi:DUF2231 domain-containing protein [Alicyclobacillus ferrooxydans]|uniref:Cytochrome c domain-containing protein n=1 Tax=Alicyclobacillus ferrooxydans TaxID=471514 RepID=A0A0P9CXH3_9BACL|nr:DUF2231 domain-containing protein [Alicyclobacillus ferrooxydans]KPV44458.1 hypothetical protein AN477_07585 [Alicyclobacillus ferrooxydans]
MPPLHPLIIHFPIALFVIAVLFDGITAFTQKTSLLSATKLLYLFGYLGTLAALITGDMLKHQRAAILPHTLLTMHEWLAIAFAVWFTVLLTVRLRRYWEPSKPYAAMAIVGLLLLVAVGHTGGSMAWPSLKSSVAIRSTGNPNTSASTSSTNNTQPTTSGQLTGSANSAASSQNNATSRTDSGNAAGVGRSSSSSSSTSLVQLGQQYFVEDCQSCHSLGVAEQYFGHPKSDWTTVVQTMQSYAGGAIPDNQAQAIIAYVSSQP